MRPQPMMSQLREPQCMGPQPIKPWPRDIFLYESLGIEFFEVLITFECSIC